MLHDAIARLGALQQRIDDLRTICERVSAHTDRPPAWMVLLPFAYHEFTTMNERDAVIDPRLCDMLGSYLGSRIPECKEYFLSPAALSRIKDYSDEIARAIEERNIGGRNTGGRNTAETPLDDGYRGSSIRITMD